MKNGRILACLACTALPLCVLANAQPAVGSASVNKKKDCQTRLASYRPRVSWSIQRVPKVCVPDGFDQRTLPLA